MSRPRYRFIERVTVERPPEEAHFTDNGMDVLVWERPIPGDSRVEQVRCYADFFWKRGRFSDG